MAKKDDVATGELVPLSPRMIEVQADVNDRIGKLGAWADTSGLVEQILNADSLAKALSVYETTKVDAILGEPLNILGCSFLQSGFTGDEDGGGLGVYALIRAVDANGEAHTISCGGTTVVATLLRAQELDALPATFKITRAPKTQAGFFPLNLEAVESL